MQSQHFVKYIGLLLFWR